MFPNYLRNLTYLEICIFSLTILKRISDFWQAFFLLRFHSIFSISFFSTRLKEKVTKESCRFLILVILGWFSYFATTFIIGHAERTVPGWSRLPVNSGMLRFGTASIKNSLKYFNNFSSKFFCHRALSHLFWLALFCLTFLSYLIKKVLQYSKMFCF